MFHRFAAASAVASIVIALAAAGMLLVRPSVQDASLLTTLWCLVPVAWGVWAMLAPSRWVPGRLAIWGAILGVAGGVAAGPWLDLPHRLGGLSGVRWLPVIVGPVLYYLLWLLVGAAYRGLQPSNRPSGAARAA